MAIFAAFLRGVNVGHTGRIKMADLKQALAGQQFTQITTYLQSGNVVFCCDEPAAAVITKIETVLQTQFALFSPVILRTAAEMQTLAAAKPFTDAAMAQAALQSGDAESYYVQLCAAPPPKEIPGTLQALQTGGTQLHLAGSDLYLLLPGGIRNSKLAQKAAHLIPLATVRNFKTIRAVAALTAQLEATPHPL